MTRFRRKYSYQPKSLLKTATALLFPSLSKRHSSRLIIMAIVTSLAASFTGTASAADTVDDFGTFGPKFFDLMKRDQAIQSSNGEATAIMWEVEGGAFCSHTPPPLIANGFQFNDGNRWRSSATNPRPRNAPLLQGDPMTLTWSFIPDTPTSSLGNGFTCGATGEATGRSDLISFLDGLYGAGPGGSNLRRRPWFSIFQAAFNNWGTLNGINYVYEPADDGAVAGSGGQAGVLGVRGDVRIGGHFIDGQDSPNTLACNFFASNGDMIIDTGNSRFYGPNPRDPINTGFRNVLEHEHGHGLSINHVCPINRTKLMEPLIATDFLGAQEDDILAANRGYGDRDEFPSQNDTSNTATSLGFIGIDRSIGRTQLSIDGSSDQDFYSFVAPANSQVSVTLTPTGSTYLDGPQNSNGSCSAGSNFNSLIENNLGMELRGQSGSNVLATANSRPAGVQETITNRLLSEGSGRYFVRITGSRDRTQMYNLSISVSSDGTTAPTDDDCSPFVAKAANGSVVTFCL